LEGSNFTSGKSLNRQGKDQSALEARISGPELREKEGKIYVLTQKEGQYWVGTGWRGGDSLTLLGGKRKRKLSPGREGLKKGALSSGGMKLSGGLEGKKIWPKLAEKGVNCPEKARISGGSS